MEQKVGKITNLERLRLKYERLSSFDRMNLDNFMLGYLSIHVPEELWNRAINAGIEVVKEQKKAFEDSKADYGSRALA